MKKILLTGAGILGLPALAVAAGLIYIINWFDNRLLPSEQDAARPVASYAGHEQRNRQSRSQAQPTPVLKRFSVAWIRRAP